MILFSKSIVLSTKIHQSVQSVPSFRSVNIPEWYGAECWTLMRGRMGCLWKLADISEEEEK